MKFYSLLCIVRIQSLTLLKLSTFFSSTDFHSSQCSCDICNLESEKPPQEFLVSPTQNSLLYPDITDSYTLQNFSGGGKFFQEALRRKTG